MNSRVTIRPVVGGSQRPGFRPRAKFAVTVLVTQSDGLRRGNERDTRTRGTSRWPFASRRRSGSACESFSNRIRCSPTRECLESPEFHSLSYAQRYTSIACTDDSSLRQYISCSFRATRPGRNSRLPRIPEHPDVQEFERIDSCSRFVFFAARAYSKRLGVLATHHLAVPAAQSARLKVIEQGSRGVDI